MAVIINELEVVLEPSEPPPQPGGHPGVPEPPQLKPHDLMTLLERKAHMGMRLVAH